MSPAPERRPLDERRGGVPGSEASVVPAAGEGRPRTAGRRRPDVVPQLGQEIGGDGLECGDVICGHVLAPAPHAARGRSEQPLLVRLRRRRRPRPCSRASQARTESPRTCRSRARPPPARRRGPRSAPRGSGTRPRAARATARRRPPCATGTRTAAGVVGCAHVRVNVPSGICRNDSAASRPSRMRWTYCASAKSSSSSSRCRMYIGVLSPQRGLPAASAYASKIAAMATPVGIPERTRQATSATETPQSRIVGIRATSSRKRSASICRP